VSLLRRGLLGFSLTLCLLGCHGQAQVAAPPTKPSSTASPHTKATSPGLFLYAVGDASARSYLLGTMHVGFGFEEVLTAEARVCFEQAQKVMMEADVTHADPAQMMQAALLPPPQSLRAMLGDPLWNQLVERVGQQVPPPVLDKLKPWMPAVILGLDDMQRALHAVRPDGESHMMDAELMQLAQKSGKELLFLETIEQQLAVFSAIPETEQVAELSRALTEDNAALGRAMIEAYAAGDEAALTASLFDEEQMRAAPGFYDAVLFQRNQRWMPVIDAQIKAGGVFVAVGAAHLFGDRGILSELKRRGLVVTRVGG